MFHSFCADGILIQYILYSPAEVVLYERLGRRGGFPAKIIFCFLLWDITAKKMEKRFHLKNIKRE